MPTVLRDGPYRLYFYSHEPNEPAHVHIDRDEATAKVWLHDGAVARSSGFSARELSVIRSIVLNNRTSLIEAWNGFFGAQ